MGKNPSYQNNSESGNSYPECPFSPSRRFPLFNEYWRDTSKFYPVFAIIWFNHFVANFYNLIIFHKFRKMLFTHMADDGHIVNMTSIPLCTIKCPFSVVIANYPCSSFTKISTTNTRMFRQFHTYIISLWRNTVHVVCFIVSPRLW